MNRPDNREFEFLSGPPNPLSQETMHNGWASHDFGSEKRPISVAPHYGSSSNRVFAESQSTTPLNASHQLPQSINGSSSSPPAPSLPPTHHQRSMSVFWSELEPWMDEEYVKQVCTLMGWEPISIKVPRSPPDSSTGHQPNNPGYCYLSFPTAAHVAQILAQVSGGTTIMPNSSKPFIMSWAPSYPPPALASPTVPSFPAMATPATITPPLLPPQNYPKEYSIFVGDLAPETSNSDLVAVFRNPVLGLRNDREPKFIRPFLSCKSAKIMLDPVTGVSRGYGFVRFTDEADQQRALIEMHGLYCLSRPMRISPATAKFKGTQTASPLETYGFYPTESAEPPISLDPQAKSVSAPIANSVAALKNVAANGPTSASGLPSGSSASSTTSSENVPAIANNFLAQLARQYINGDGSELRSPQANPYNHPDPFIAAAAAVASSQRQSPYSVASPVEESWKHHAQARAILGNLIGPNGEQLTSTDPYNTTVFVGGLSPLISEDTLRTFFAPFGDIHYVKVPVGKHCGFVQFVRKADAERAIEKMQGFPVGGSRIRLSWGRSQYKAAQAAAQAAQTAALQAQYSAGAGAPSPNSYNLTHEQAIALLQKYGYFDPKPGLDSAHLAGLASQDLGAAARQDEPAAFKPYSAFSPGSGDNRQLDVNMSGGAHRHAHTSSFSPFSPDPSMFGTDKRRDSVTAISDPSNAVAASQPPFVPGQSPLNGINYYPHRHSDLIVNTTEPIFKKNGLSPTSTRPPSASKYTNYFSGSEKQFPSPHTPSGDVHPPPQSEEELLHDVNGTLASLDLDSKSNGASM